MMTSMQMHITRSTTTQTAQFEHNQNTPSLNMSFSRESTMENYKFTERRISHYKMPTLHTIPDNESNLVPRQLPRRRVVFLSIASLNASIESLPPYILRKALFCFKAER